jgi:apolipoprotein N-acyltransferase
MWAFFPLQERGLDVEQRNAGQSTALMWAANTGHSAVCSQLLALSADVRLETKHAFLVVLVLALVLALLVLLVLVRVLVLVLLVLLVVLVLLLLLLTFLMMMRMEHDR